MSQVGIYKKEKTVYKYSGTCNISDCRSPEAKLCAELSVPGFNTTAPLYHQLQQYRQSSDTVKKRERDPQSVVMEDHLPEVDAHQSSALSVNSVSKSSEVHIFIARGS